MAIENKTSYIKIDQDRIFNCNGLIPILVYRSAQDRTDEKKGEKLIGIKMPRPQIVNLKFNGDITPTTDKDIILNIVTAMYVQLKAGMVKKTVMTVVEEPTYKDYLDC